MPLPESFHSGAAFLLPPVYMRPIDPSTDNGNSAFHLNGAEWVTKQFRDTQTYREPLDRPSRSGFLLWPTFAIRSRAFRFQRVTSAVPRHDGA